MFKSTKPLLGTIALFLLVSFSSQADEGKATYQQCLACHGANGEGNKVLSSPALAGQSKDYLARQLTLFKEGKRGAHPKDTYGMQMTAIVAGLDEQSIRAVSAYISELTPMPATKDTSGNERKGFALFQGKCGACHGGDAHGNPAFNAPRLAGLSTDYLKRQMENYQGGVRGADKDDRLGRQMAAMSRTVNEEQLKDILYYISLKD